MTSIAVEKERKGFSERLFKAMQNAGYRPTQGVLTKNYNLRAQGNTVTTYSVAKWLNGESLPTRDKMRVLAEWLGVSVEWLAFGKEAVDSGEVGHKALTRKEVMLVHDIRAMSDYGRKLVYELVRVVVSAEAARITVQGMMNQRKEHPPTEDDDAAN